MLALRWEREKKNVGVGVGVGVDESRRRGEEEGLLLLLPRGAGDDEPAKKAEPATNGKREEVSPALSGGASTFSYSHHSYSYSRARVRRVSRPWAHARGCSRV